MEILPQILIFALISSAIYALISCGLTLTFGTLEFINFAHGEIVMVGAFSFYFFHISLGLSMILSLFLSIFFVALLGIAIEKTTFKPVRNKQEFIPLVLSIGVSIILQSIVTMKFGGGSQSYFKPGEYSKTFELFNGTATITAPQITIIVSSILLLALLFLFLKYSKTGKAIRAVSDNKEMASIMGINVDRTITILFAIAAGLAAIAGILIAFDQNLHPQMGIMLNIKSFAAIVLGGVGKFHGAIVGALIIGFSENLIIGLTNISGSYKDLIIFIILLLMLLFKPYGLFGGSKQEAESR